MTIHWTFSGSYLEQVEPYVLDLFEKRVADLVVSGMTVIRVDIVGNFSQNDQNSYDLMIMEVILFSFFFKSDRRCDGHDFVGNLFVVTHFSAVRCS